MPLVVLIGGSGFIGRNVAQKFAREGWRVRVAVRRPNEAISMRPYGDVGQVEPIQANMRDDASIQSAVRDADVVVNLVGLMYETGAQTFEAVHVAGARRAAQAAKQAGVGRFVQVSAIGADVQSPSAYARTRAEGERAVREVYPDAVIVRPSIVFGPEDDFFNRFAGMARLTPALPLVGGDTKFAPVYVADLAEAIFAASIRDDAAGETYEIGGPRTYTFRELLELTCKTIHRKRLLAPIPFFAASIQGAMLDLLPYVSLGFVRNTILTADQVKLLKSDNIPAPDAPGLASLGVETPATVEAIIPSYLYRFRPYGQYNEEPEET